MTDMATRKAFGEALIELGKVNEDIVVLDADISKSTNSVHFHNEFPERAYNMGIAEQNMVGVAAGMASTGLPVFATTYAVFASMRALEQVRTFICYPELNVKIVASHGGLQVSSDGASHQGLEDIAIMRAVANMTIVQPADAASTKKAVFAAAEFEGPMYIRLMRNPVPAVYEEEMDFEIGKGNVLKSDDNADCTIVATGLMVHKALAAAETLNKEGLNLRVIDIHTIKPIDEELLVKAAEETGAVVTAEDHNIIGGLGGAVSEVLSTKMPVPVEIIGVQDCFGESGDPEELFTEYCMNTEHIVEAVKRVVKRK